MTTSVQDLRHRIQKALASQRNKTVTVLSSLLVVQDELGYVPEEAVQEVAEYTDKTINDVWGVASFYTNFRFSPPREHVVEVCWGPSCHVRGAMAVIGELSEALSISGEEDTADGKVAVRFNTCLGACAQGPVFSVDHKLKGRLTPERVREIAQSLLSLPRKGDHA